MINLAKRNIKNNTSIDLSRTPDEDHHSSVFQIDDRQVFKVEEGKQMVVHNRLNLYGRLIIRGQLILI